MNIKEFYEKIEGDYEGILGRLGSDALIYRFVLKFADEKSFGEVMAAVETGDIQDTLSAVHKMKGVVANLGFSKMLTVLTDLLAWLRQENQDTINMDMINELIVLYNETVKLIEEL